MPCELHKCYFDKWMRGLRRWMKCALTDDGLQRCRPLGTSRLWKQHAPIPRLRCDSNNHNSGVIEPLSASRPRGGYSLLSTDAFDSSEPRQNSLAEGAAALHLGVHKF
jgi:hypothetical protein